MQSNPARVYNIISLVFVALTVLFAVFVVIQMSGSANADTVDPALVAIPTPFVLPSLTPTSTPTPTTTGTATPTPTDTATPSATFTPTETFPPTPSITFTPGPTLTPSDTPTPSVSPEPSATPTPTGPTPTLTPSTVPRFFEVSGDVFFGPNTVNQQQCSWQGMGGSVIGIDGAESQRQFQVRVFNSSAEYIATTGSNSLYGQFSGWEVPLGIAPAASMWFVRLETEFGTPVSDDYQLTFPGTCETNSAIIRFQQIQAFGPATAAPPDGSGGPPVSTPPGP